MIQIASNFIYKGKHFLDGRESFSTLLEMTSFSETSIPDGFLAYCEETDKHYKFNRTNDSDPVTGKWREFNSGTSVDEKVKLTSLSTEASYLSDLLDDSTIKVDTDNNVIHVVKIKDQTVTVAEINLLQGLTGNVQEQINNLSKSMSMYGVFQTKTELLTETGVTPPEDGATAIIREDETANNVQMTYIYISKNAEWTPVSESSVEIRDFTVNPIDLSKEVTGVLPESKIDSAITRNADLVNYLDKTTFMSETNTGSVKSADNLIGLGVSIEQINQAVSAQHSHTNSAALDKVVDDGTGVKFLSDDGTYKNVLSISSSAPENKNFFWVDNTDITNLKLKVYDGTSWKEISSSSSGSSGSGSAVLSQSVTSNVEVGGVSSGYTFPAGATLDQIVTTIFNKYYEPEVTFKILPETKYYETGTTTTGIKMVANVVKKSNSISNVDFYVNNSKIYSLDTESEPTLPNGGEFSYTYNGNVNKDATFKVVVKDNKVSLTFSESIYFVVPYYYGTSSSYTVSSLDGLSKVIAGKEDVEFSVTASNEYIVFAYNSSYGELSSLLDANGFENISSFVFKTLTINGITHNVYLSDTKITCKNFKYVLKF